MSGNAPHVAATAQRRRGDVAGKNQAPRATPAIAWVIDEGKPVSPGSLVRPDELCLFHDVTAHGLFDIGLRRRAQVA